ncbi:MAG: hypothetical protein U0V87_05430 [Acidobacteriota bacterium]
MPNVVFVAPFFREATLRFVEAAAALPGVRLGLVSQDPEERLPPGLRQRLAAHQRVSDGLDAQQIADATRVCAQRQGSVDRLIGMLEDLQVPLGEVRDALRLPGIGADAARNFRDKARMKDVLSKHGLPCAKHRLAHTSEQVLEFVREIGFPVVAKPPAGAGSRNTFRLDDHDQLTSYLRMHTPSAERPAMVEEFIVGQEHSFDSVCIDGRLIWYSINHYFPGPLEVVETPWIQWAVLLPREVQTPEYSAIVQAARHALPVLGIGTNMSHMEWFRRSDGTVAISEVGARPPGAQFTTLISYAHDTDFYRAWSRLMIFDQFDPPERRYAAGAAYLRGQGHGRVKAVHGLEHAQKELGGLVVEAKLPHPGQAPGSGYEGEGYVIVRHPDTEVVSDALRRLITLIRVELG